MIKNIVLDMGNVLLLYDPNVPLDLFCRTKQEKETVRRELFEGPEWVEGDLGHLTNEEKYERIKKRIPSSMHPSLKRCVYEWPVCMKPVSDAYAFCEYLKERGYKLYVLSNAASDFYDYFERFAPFDYFDGIVVSSDVHRIKPDPEIYRHLFNAYRLNPEECLFLDDRMENVKGAEEAGMQGELFQNNFQEIKRKYGL